MTNDVGALQTLIDALENEIGSALGIGDAEARRLAFRRLESVALDASREAMRQNAIAPLASALRLSALGGLYKNDWGAPRAHMCRRLRLARRLLLQWLADSSSTHPEQGFFQLAKIESIRASILEQAYRQRSVRGMHAAYELFGKAEDIFRTVGEDVQAIRQCANKAQAMFAAGTLGDLQSYEVAAKAFELAAEGVAEEISAEQRTIWSGFCGSALGALAEQGRSEHLETAAQLMHGALSMLEGSANIPAYAMIGLNLAGLAMHSRSATWQRDIEDSIARLERIRPMVEHDRELAPAIDYTLCAAYIFAPGGTLTGNIERAIEVGARSLAALKESKSPADTAKAYENLAMAYAMRVRGDHAENFARAMDLIEYALRLTPRTRNPTAWSDRQGNAGRILLFHGTSNPRRYALAFLRLRLALKARPPRERLGGPAGILHLNAAVALLAMDGGCRSACRLTAAERAARLAVDAFTCPADAESRRRAIVVLAECKAATGDWQKALELLEQARDMAVSGAGQFRRGPEIFSTATRALGFYSDMNTAAAYTAVKAGHPKRALDFLEDAKAVALRRVLGESRLQDYGSSQQLAPDDVIVALAPVFHREGAAILIVRKTAERTDIVDVVDLTGVTRQSLIDFLHLGSPRVPPFSQALYADDAAGVSSAVGAATEWLWTFIVAPIVRSLETHLSDGTPHLVLCPQAGSGAIPWHAAAATRSLMGALWTRRRRLTYLPSLRLLPAIPRWRREVSKIVTVADPTGDLAWSKAECDLTARLAGGKRQHFGAREASRDAIASACADASVIHFSGHGGYDAFNPQSSKLYFDRDSGLSIGEIAANLRLKNGPLVTLASCESGVADFTERSDEFLGMPSAFIAAGASCVIASQWKVSDEISALFFVDLYRRIYQQGMVPADAIVATADMVRTLSPDAALDGNEGWSVSEATLEEAIDISSNPDRPFEHPFYWAPFVLTGLGW